DAWHAIRDHDGFRGDKPVQQADHVVSGHLIVRSGPRPDRDARLGLICRAGRTKPVLGNDPDCARDFELFLDEMVTNVSLPLVVFNWVLGSPAKPDGGRTGNNLKSV